jgi:2-polyprenyl-3-methyl-5-hydroxy-6-metoxy-1,4-benzoquinol methylase
VACGSGYGSNHMMKKGAYMVVGGDVSKEAIRDAIRFYRGERAYYLILDAQRLPFKNNSFDIVVCFETIEHLHRYEDFIKEIKRILKTNGVFICSTPNKAAHTKRSPYHVHEFTIDEFRSLLEKYFKDVTLYGYYPLLKKDQLKGNVESLIKFLLLNLLTSLTTKQILRLESFINFLAKLPPFYDHRITTLEEIRDLEQIHNTNDNRYVPSLLEMNSPLFAYIIAVAKA